MKYEIEKNIPIPKTRSRNGSKWDFVKSLEHEDSFVVDTEQRNCFYQYATKRKIKFVTRLLYEFDRQKVRIWILKK